MKEHKIKKILFLGSQMETGGAQKVLLDQAQWFYKKGYLVEVAFFYDKEGLYEDWQRFPFPVANLHAWSYKGNLILNGLRLIVGAFQLVKLMRRGKFDVIETFTPDSNLIGIPLAWLVRIPVRIATNHGVIRGTGKFRHKFHGLLINSILTSKLVAVSEKVKHLSVELENIDSDKINVILNGIDPIERISPEIIKKTKNELGVKEEHTVILSVGRLSEQKGHRYLLDAISNLPNEIKNSIQVLIAGQGDQFDQLENQINKLEIHQQVSLLGLRHDVPALLQIADIFVLPSVSEGLPLVVLEAMSVGIPVIATNVPGIEDVISDGETGLIVPIRDAGELTEKMTYLFRQKSIRDHMGLNAKNVFEGNHTLDKMCLKYETLFDDLI